MTPTSIPQQYTPTDLGFAELGVAIRLVGGGQPRLCRERERERDRHRDKVLPK